jgi:hypothetical protein
MPVSGGTARRIPGEFRRLLDAASKAALDLSGGCEVAVGERANVNFDMADGQAGYSGEVVDIVGPVGQQRVRIVCPDYPEEGVYDHWWPAHFCSRPHHVLGRVSGGGEAGGESQVSTANDDLIAEVTAALGFTMPPDVAAMVAKVYALGKKRGLEEGVEELKKMHEHFKVVLARYHARTGSMLADAVQAGALAMREMAAEHCEIKAGDLTHDEGMRFVASWCAKDIRALPLPEVPVEMAGE